MIQVNGKAKIEKFDTETDPEYVKSEWKLKEVDGKQLVDTDFRILKKIDNIRVRIIFVPYLERFINFTLKSIIFSTQLFVAKKSMVNIKSSLDMVQLILAQKSSRMMRSINIGRNI